MTLCEIMFGRPYWTWEELRAAMIEQRKQHKKYVIYLIKQQPFF